MKKAITAAALALVLTLTSGMTASACGHRRSQYACSQPNAACVYIDANGNGICDNHENSGRCGNYADADGDGICDVCHNEKAHCSIWSQDGRNLCWNGRSHHRGGCRRWC